MVTQDELDAWSQFMAAALAAGHEPDKAAETADKSIAIMNARLHSMQQQQQPQGKP